MRFLELAWDAIRNSVQALTEWLAAMAEAGVFDARTWPLSLWLVLALVVLAVSLLVLVRRRRLGAARAVPEMMISHGEIALVDGPVDTEPTPAYGAAAPARASHRLSLTLSNLNPWPVQLLELAVRTRGLRQPVVAEAGAVVPPNGAVDVVAELFDLPGDVGVVELFIYSNRGARRTYRLSAPLEWEPWDQRFRIRALSTRVAPVGRLASQEKRQRERRSYQSAKRRERQKDLAEATWRRAEEFTSRLRERRAGAADKRVTALASEQTGGGLNGNGAAPVRPAHAASNGVRRVERADDGATRPGEERSRAQEPQEPRRLDFPDEF